MIKKIKIPIYYSDLIIIQKKSLKKIPKKYNIQKYDFNGYAAAVYTSTNKYNITRFIMIFLKDTSSKIIAHEAFHCACDIMKTRNIPITVNDTCDEHTAYLIEWIAEQCFKYLKYKRK